MLEAGTSPQLLSPDGVDTLDDLKVGARYDFGAITVAKEDIIDFAKKFDPQYFHTDEQAAKNSMFGGLVASGLHTLALVHRAAVTNGFVGRAGKAGIGFPDARLHHPLRPGDTLHVVAEVLSIRASSRRLDQGYVRIKYDVANQNGDRVLTWITDGVFHRRRDSRSR